MSARTVGGRRGRGRASPSGAEHTMTDGADPARNRETVATDGLRQAGERWVIATWVPGWSRHGSALRLGGLKPGGKVVFAELTGCRARRPSRLQTTPTA